MAYSVAQMKTDISSILHGTTLNSVQNIDQLIFRAASEVLEDVDPQETKRIIDIGTPLFDSVYDYPAPVDLKGDKVIDIRPQVNRQQQDNFTQTYNQVFDLTKTTNGLYPTMTINFNNAIKSLRLSKVLNQGVLVNPNNTLNNNGTFVLGGDANTLTVDNINFATGNGSLKFNLDGTTGSGYIENSTMTAVNLSQNINQGNNFIYTYLPYLGNATPFTSVVLRWGSSPTDYWENTVTVNQMLIAFINGWNLLSFAWDGATVVGAPDDTAVNYERVTFNYAIGTPVNNVRIDALTSRLGIVWEIEYYSKYLFRSVITGAFQETVERDDDLINLDTETYMLLFNKCAHLVAQQNSGTDGYFDVQYYSNQYMKSLQRYQAMYKSEVTKPKQNYYNRTNNNYQNWFGRGSGQR